VTETIKQKYALYCQFVKCKVYVIENNQYQF